MLGTPRQTRKKMKTMTDPTFGVVAFVTDVESTVDNLLGLDYPANKVKFHIVSTSKDPEKKMIALDQLKHKFNHSTLTMNLVEQELYQMETAAFAQVKGAKYFVMLDEGQRIDPLFLRKVADKQDDADLYVDKDIVAVSSNLAVKNYLEYADFKIMQNALEEEATVNYLNEE